jgi:hypothetical protein
LSAWRAFNNSRPAAGPFTIAAAIAWVRAPRELTTYCVCAAGLIVLYLLKFAILKLAGWIFNISRAVDIYLFVVFMTNKIIGIFLLPFLVLISFSGPVATDIEVTVSIITVGLFYINRFIAAYNNLYKEIKISVLHFFLYLCAFEIAPLLLIYKVLLTYLEKAY